MLEFSLAENLALHDYRAAARLDAAAGSSRAGMVERARRLLREFDVRGGGPRHARGGLSGGNQQKVVLAREIDARPEGADRRAADAAVSTSARSSSCTAASSSERDEGRAILLVSLELEEILSLSDRILVIYEGRIVGEFPPTATEEELGLADDRRRPGRRRAGGMSDAASPRHRERGRMIGEEAPRPVRLRGLLTARCASSSRLTVRSGRS